MKEWFVWEKIRRIHPLQVLDVFAYMSNMPAPALSMRVGAKFENGNVELIGVEKEMVACGKSISERVFSDPKWFWDFLNRMDSCSENQFEVAKRILKENLHEKTYKELASLFRELHDAYFDSHKMAAWMVPSDLVDDSISRGVEKILENKIKEKQIDVGVGNASAILSQPQKEGVLVEERKAFLQLLDRLLANKKLTYFFRENTVGEIAEKLNSVAPDFEALLYAHWEKFQWIFFMYEGPALEKKYFIEELKKNLDNGMYIAMELEESKKVLKEQAKLIESLSSSEEERMVFSFLRRLIETKGYRKDAMYFGSFVLEKVCKEISKRLGITTDQVRYTSRAEAFGLLDGKFSDFEQLNERVKFSVFLMEKGNYVSLVGEKAKDWYIRHMVVPDAAKVSELHGTVAFRGFVRGRVRIINHPNEMVKMNKGDILVSHATNPNLLPAMTKAAAIVTDMGGVTCHAAIVSREFHIPCVVGTKYATQVLKDDDLVEVDAEKGIIKIIGAGSK